MSKNLSQLSSSDLVLFKSILNNAEGNLYPETKGAVGDGVTDDTNAINAALAASPIVIANPKARYKCSGSLIVPDGHSFIGPWKSPGRPVNGQQLDYRTMTGQLIMDPTASVILNGASASISGFVMRNKNVGVSTTYASPTFAQDAATIVSQFAGTGIIANKPDPSVSDMLLLGFGQAINCEGGERGEFARIKFDCLNGIRLREVYDVGRLDRCHGWPFLTVVDDVFDARAMGAIRSGTAFAYHDTTDGWTINACFSYGYHTGHLFDNTRDMSLIGCWADYPPGANDTTGIGFHNYTGSRNTRLVDCSSASLARGVVHNSDDVLTLNDWSSWVIKQAHIDHLLGTLITTNANINKLSTQHNGVDSVPASVVGIRENPGIRASVHTGTRFKDIQAWAIDPSVAASVQRIVSTYENCSGDLTVNSTSPVGGEAVRGVAVDGQNTITMPVAIPTGCAWWVEVYVKGVRQEADVNYTSDGSTVLKLNFNMVAGDKFRARRVRGIA